MIMCTTAANRTLVIFHLVGSRGIEIPCFKLHLTQPTIVLTVRLETEISNVRPVKTKTLVIG